MARRRYSERSCLRCFERFGFGPRCRTCGVGRDRKVRRTIRGRPLLVG